MRTQGDRPSGPPEADFIVANTSHISLNLNMWDDHRCQILYFVIEYKLHTVDTWTTGKEERLEIAQNTNFTDKLSVSLSVTNDLLPQPRYSIRGLMSDTLYDLKVTAHNHAGSTSLRYNLLD